MADFPIYDGSVFEAIGVSAADSGGTLLTSGAIHTKGAWTELSASAPEGITSFFFQIHRPITHSRMHFDLGIGAAGSEVVLVPDMRQFTRQDCGGIRFYVPMAIPGGVRVAARMQAGAATQTCDVSLGVFRGGFLTSPPLMLATHYGITAATTSGTEIDPGAVVNTKGTAVQLTASCNQIRSMIINLGQGVTAAGSYTRDNSNFLLDIGTGAAGFETYIISNMPFVTRSISDLPEPTTIGPFDCYIPAGTRIVARAQSEQNVTNYRQFDVSILGFN